MYDAWEALRGYNRDLAQGRPLGALRATVAAADNLVVAEVLREACVVRAHGTGGMKGGVSNQWWMAWGL